jgi:hypothetical protein
MLVVAAAGCGSKKDAAGEDSVYAARFEAAEAIRIDSERDAAMVKLSADAAAGGNVEVVKKCLKAIQIDGTRDAAAAAAALALGKSGQVDAATDVAKTIQLDGRRDAILSKIAKGEY